MSYSVPRPSYSQFEVIFDTALKEYAQTTGTDLTTHPLAAALEACNSQKGIILDVLLRHAREFGQYQDGVLTIELERHLEPTIDVLVGLSTAGVFAEGSGFVRTFSFCVLSNSHLSSYRSFHQRRRYLLALVSYSQSVSSPTLSARRRDGQVF